MQNQIVYDFQLKTISYPLNKAKQLNYVEYRKPSTLKISNINTLLYEISIKGETIELNGETPDVFKLFFNAEKFINPTKDQNADPSLTSTENKVGVEKYNAAVEAVMLHLKALEETKVIYDNIYLVAFTEGKNYQEIIDQIKALRIFDAPQTVLLSKAEIISACKSRYEEYGKKIEAADEIYESLSPDEQKKVESKSKGLNSLNKKVEKFDYKDLFQKIAVLYEKATDPNTFSYTSSPIIAEKDYINYALEIKPKKDLRFTQPSREEKFELPIYVRGGVKVDFSTGVFFASKEIMDRKYHADSIPNDSINKIIVREKTRNVFSPFIGAMIHASFRGPGWFKPALSVGLGLNSTNFADAVYCLGLSGIFGNEERFILSLGAIGKQANELKGRYENNGNISKTDFTKNEDLVEKTFKVGFFVGFTYNLTSKKKGQ